MHTVASTRAFVPSSLAPESERDASPAAEITIDQAFAAGRKLVEFHSRRFARFGGDRDDLRQEGFVALLSAARTWRADGGASFQTWVSKRIYSTLCDLMSRERRRGLTARGGGGRSRVLGKSRDVGVSVACTASIDDDSAADGRSLHDVIGIAPTQEAALCEAEYASKVRSAIDLLSPRDRTIWDRSIDGATTIEIGRQLEMEPSNVTWRLAKLCDDLRTTIETGKGVPGEDRRQARSRQITHDGLTMSLPAWGRRVGLRAYMISRRLEAGWSVADALTSPPHPSKGRRGKLPAWDRSELPSSSSSASSPC